MSVKKMIGVATIATAAIVVPAQVDAVEVDLFNGANSVQVGNELSVSYENSVGSAVLINKIEWFIGGTKIDNNTAKFKVPYEANGKKIKAEVTLQDGSVLFDEIDVAEKVPVPSSNLITANTAKFKDVITVKPLDNSGNAISVAKYKWYIGEEEQTNATTNSFTVPFAARGKEVKVVAIAANGVDAYTDSIAISNISQSDELKIEHLDGNGNWQTGNTKINDEIRANVSIPGTIDSIEWYIADGDKTSFLAKTDTLEFDVPIIASNRTLRVIITMDSGDQYYNDVNVEEFKLKESNEFIPTIKVGGKEIPGLTTSLAPNDVLTVDPIDLEEFGLLASQLNVTYQWYFTTTDGKTGLKVTNATGNSYTIPNDMDMKALQNFKVVVTLEVPEISLIENYNSPIVSLSTIDAKTLNSEIEEYFDINSYKEYNTDLLDKIAIFKSAYDLLSPESKLLVTNYKKVKEAEADILLVKPLIKKLEDFTNKLKDYSNDGILNNHNELLKEIKTIETSYNSLTSLQQSLVDQASINETPAELVELLMKYVPENNYENSTTLLIEKINAEIIGLINLDDSLLNSYKLPLEDLKQSINKLNQTIKTVDKTYQPLIKTNILKSAQTDIKKAESVLKDIDKITSAAANKKASAADKARKNYNKLTPLQKSLISPEDLEKIEDAEESSVSKVEALKEKIDSLISSNNPSQYNFNAEIFTDKSINQGIETLISDYKALTSAERKQITNYATVTQLKKDIKAAETAKKAIAALDKAMNDIYNAVSDKDVEKKEKAAYSKYLSAFKAFTKLTPLQKSILNNPVFVEDLELQPAYDEYFSKGNQFEDLLKVPEVKESDNPEKQKPIPTVDNALTVVSEIEAFYKDVTSGAYNSLEADAEVKKLLAQYNALLPAEKKNVYNYSLISTVKSNISKANSVLRKFIAASTPEKRQNALQAYNKLTPAQQALLTSEFIDLTNAIELDKEGKIPTDDLVIKIDQLSTALNVTELFIEIEQTVSSLSSKELKAVPNYKLYQNIAKEYKAAQKFVEKVKKLGNTPTYSKKQSILNDFNKLSEMQVKFLNSMKVKEDDTDSVTVLLNNWAENADTNAINLNNTIGQIFNGNTYNVSSLEDIQSIQDLKTAISSLESQYKALDSKEKKLVTNYKVLSSIKTDISKVEPILAIYETLFDENLTIEQKNAINKKLEEVLKKLSKRQLSLYDELGGHNPFYE